MNLQEITHINGRDFDMPHYTDLALETKALYTVCSEEYKYPGKVCGSYIEYSDEFESYIHLSGEKISTIPPHIFEGNIVGDSYGQDSDIIYDIEITYLEKVDEKIQSCDYIILNYNLPGQKLVKYELFTKENPIIFTSGKISTIGIISNNGFKKKVTYKKCWYSDEIRRKLFDMETKFTFADYKEHQIKCYNCGEKDDNASPSNLRYIDKTKKQLVCRKCYETGGDEDFYFSDLEYYDSED